MCERTTWCSAMSTPSSLVSLSALSDSSVPPARVLKVSEGSRAGCRWREMDAPPLVMQRNGYFLPSGLLPVRIWRACLACGRTFWPCLRTPSMSNAKAGGCFGAADEDREGQRRKACGSRMTHRRRGSERQQQRGGSRTGARARVQASSSVSQARVQLCEPRGSERSRDKEREEQLAVDTHRSPLLYRLSRARDLAQLPRHP